MEDVEQLENKLLKLAHNLWWTWHPEVIDVWRSIDTQLWRESRHSPVIFIRKLGKDRLKKLCADASTCSKLNHIFADLNRYLTSPSTWGDINASPLKVRPIAYFCAEFGIHESLPLYSGGLGVLAGDHLKSASDLGIPIIGVSLFYREGYFHQRLSDKGEQGEDFELLDPQDLPLIRVKDAQGNHLTVNLTLEGKSVQIGAWTTQIGRVPLYFLDMESAFREMGIQNLGLRLYGGDEAVRLAQEMILGVGGMRLLLRLGVRPAVIHLNEGHSAFAPLEYARNLMEEHAFPFRVALKQTGARTIFTTHTPVPAGHDRFSSDLIGKTTWRFRESLGLSHEEFMDLGRIHAGDRNEPFCMTTLALKTASKSNAVSSIHGQVSRRMWSALWPNQSPQQIPIGHITNGINVLGWLAPPMRQLFHRYFPPGWEQRIGEREIWSNIYTIPEEELWHTAFLLRTQLGEYLTRPPQKIYPKEVRFDPGALTIGFARRFAAYKRANLLLEDKERLLKILSNPKHPVQIVFSGKAHPRDSIGKEIIKKIFQFANDPLANGKVIFIEDYDINVGRHMIQGCDLWLNTPRQGYEASGTSGMKVALNGGLNLAVLDGWWPEGYDGTNGFAVRGSRNENDALRDARDREDLFMSLENEIIPLYYDKDAQGIPQGWVKRMKEAMFKLGWLFSSDRMVMDYTLNCYIPAAGISTCQMNPLFI
ncbi:MAG: alpha-glucan family phosphorylase [Deltaproteobacteria bacterium]|nr:alpha-glucan family phosphorylase [Deltaproteobacteria bacterium]